MNKIKNEQGVRAITMRPTAYTKCKIGQDWYKCEFEAIFIPGDCYPDYMEVNAYVMENIDGMELNIEEAAQMLHDFLLKYEPIRLTVINHIKGCKTHFDVDVVIGDY